MKKSLRAMCQWANYFGMFLTGCFVCHLDAKTSFRCSDGRSFYTARNLRVADTPLQYYITYDPTTTIPCHAILVPSEIFIQSSLREPLYPSVLQNLCHATDPCPIYPLSTTLQPINRPYGYLFRFNDLIDHVHRIQ